MEEKQKFAVFIDYDNIEIGVKSTLHRELDVECIFEGLKERGEIISKIAYGNWSRHPEATRSFTSYGVQMVQRDSTPRGDKNGADINLALDALEMAFTRDHINAFAIISGDSDFMALVNKLKQFNKRVYIVGGKAFTSTILQRNCHEFISYESLLDLAQPKPGRRGGGRPRSRRSLPITQAIPLLDRSIGALERRGVTPQLGLLKSTMLQLDPAFSERDYGASSFSAFVEKLAEKKHIKLKTLDGQQVIDRPAAREEEPEEPAGPRREDALVPLQACLRDNVELLRIGIPAKEIEALLGAAEEDFSTEEFGFQEFEELLNLAQDQGLLRSDPDDDSEILRYFPGKDLDKPLEPAAEAEPEENGDRPRRSRRSRRRRGKGSRRTSEEAGEPEPEREAEPEAQAGEAKPKAPRKKAARKKAAKKAARKATKKAARKVAAKPEEKPEDED